jgi:hypothetical protein
MGRNAAGVIHCGQEKGISIRLEFRNMEPDEEALFFSTARLFKAPLPRSPIPISFKL